MAAANVGVVKPNAWMIAGAAVAVLTAAVYLRLGRAPGSPDLSPPVNRGQPTAPGSPSRPMASPAPEPGLDQELSMTYRKALEGQRIRVLGLAIIDQRARGSARRADILYQTATDGRIASLRPEIVRIISPGANPQLALDTITVRAVRSNGVVVIAVSVTVPEVDRWLKGQMPDDEFYGRWIVRVPSR